jgi:uncharacterized Zn finger protein
VPGYYDDGQWPAYVSVAERRRKAERAVAKLAKKGAALSPVIVEGRKIATTFWGKAWCDNLESYRDFEYRLERGRSYVRNGLVIDLHIAPHTVTAMVSGTSVYDVKITINEVPKSQWTAICKDCAGGIDSLVELLQGRFSKPVMERICRQGTGLFPKPSEIKFSCSCLDYASMCKHVAATLYGIGARLDVSPELLFRLRGVNENDLVADIGNVLPQSLDTPVTGKVLQDDDMAALFGLEMGDAQEAAEIAVPPVAADKVTTRRTKVTPAAKPTAKKKVSATKVRQTASALQAKTEAQPVEWWKPATSAKPIKRQPGKSKATSSRTVKARS